MKKIDASKPDTSSYIQLGILGVLIVIAFLLGSLLQKSDTKDTSKEKATTEEKTVTPTAKPKIGITEVKEAFNKAVIKFGDTDKKVVFIEVSDPSCPYCSIAGGKNGELNKQATSERTDFTLVADGGTYVAPVVEMKKLVDSGEASFALIYTNGHGAGEMAMKALYCAYDQGKFWEANDLIMSGAGYELVNNTVKNDKTKAGILATFLSTVLDKGKMEECLSSGKYDAQIITDSSTASSIGVSGTPGFFVNETNFSGAYSYTDMDTIVKKALGK